MRAIWLAIAVAGAVLVLLAIFRTQVDVLVLGCGVVALASAFVGLAGDVLGDHVAEAKFREAEERRRRGRG